MFCIALYYPPHADARDNFDLALLGDFELGLEIGYNGPKIDKNDVPNEVRREAANPTIFNDRSGNTFDVDRIGTYNPSESFGDIFYRGFARFLITDYSLRPFIELGAGGGEKSHNTTNGEFNDGYSYFKILNCCRGVDYIGYWYGIKYKASPFIPAAGVSYDFNNNWRFLGRVMWQEVTIKYRKGVEAFGKPEQAVTLATTHHDLLTYSLGVEFGNEVGSVGLNPWYQMGTNGLESGFGGSVTFTLRFLDEN